MEKEIYDFETENAFLDGLIEMLESLPKPAIQIAVPKRVREMMCAKRLLECAFGADEVEVELHFLGSCGSLCFECDALEIHKLTPFVQAVRLANNFEIYPLINGKVRFAMMFYGLFRTVAYQE